MSLGTRQSYLLTLEVRYVNVLFPLFSCLTHEGRVNWGAKQINR